MRTTLCTLLIVFGFSASLRGEASTSSTSVTKPGCLSCHVGIEPIRDYKSMMMRRIFSAGGPADPEGCAVCHGGDPAATTKEKAHQGKTFYPDPGSPWINEQTCGSCHPEHVGTQWTSLMMTESGKIQGVAWSFGSLQGNNHTWGNYDARNPTNPAARQGTDAYRAYMDKLKKSEPAAFPDAQMTLPNAPTDGTKLKDQPQQVAFTQLRAECLRCHLAVRGQPKRGDYRGMGCSACHSPYSNEGFYEGQDKSIPRNQPGHMLVHSMHSTRKAKVTVHGQTYSGIPTEVCTSCHSRGKRIGVSFQGLMEIEGQTPFTDGGKAQIDLHGKRYQAMHQDIHARKGMVCQDCHTTSDVHGDGFLCGASLAQVQIECTDCHGTPQKYPWELPLGYMDEFSPPSAEAAPRGTTVAMPNREIQGTVHDQGKDHLLTARGNPFPEVVRAQNTVIVHTAGGKDLTLKPLKLLQEEGRFNTAARVAMYAVGAHINKMECYGCHAQWVPQRHGQHVRVDYSGGKKSFDWVAAGHLHGQGKHAAETSEMDYPTTVAGTVDEQTSYVRHEEPALAVNGEGRVSPAVPGCQTCLTIIGPDGRSVVQNRIFRTPPNTQGAGAEGQLAMDFSPGQPHTMGTEARSCESCHISEKALGHGIEGGRLSRPPNTPVSADLKTADGQVLPKQTRAQIEPIEGLSTDWSRFVTEDGKQLMTVGHHFTQSRPLNTQERNNMDRRHLCLACHQEIPRESLAVSILHHAAKYADLLPKNRQEHHSLVHKNLMLAAWGQVMPMFGGPVVVLVVAIWWFRRRVRAKAQGGKTAE